MAGMEFNYEYDGSNFRQMLLDFPAQFKTALSLGSQVTIDGTIEQIVVIGMGGSGMAGRLLQNYVASQSQKIPVTLVQDYEVPEYALKNALVFVVSYSGNTEETLAAYRLIGRTGVKCVVISSGGKLAQIAPMFSSEFIQVPDATLPPRIATAYLFVPMLNILMKNGIIGNTAYRFEAVGDALSKDIYENYAKDLVEQIGPRTPVMYTGTSQSAIGYAWKGAFNETAKTFAFSDVLPESSHNELESYAGSSPNIDDFAAILLKDPKGDKRTQDAMDKYKQIIRKKGGTAMEVVIRSADPLSYTFTTLYLGYWVAYYMALAKQVDPIDVKTIEEFKKR